MHEALKESNFEVRVPSYTSHLAESTLAVKNSEYLCGINSDYFVE